MLVFFFLFFCVADFFVFAKPIDSGSLLGCAGQYFGLPRKTWSLFVLAFKIVCLALKSTAATK